MERAEELQLRSKPLLRGVSHEIAFYLAVAGNAVLLLRARGGFALAGASVYGGCLCALLGVSALYHRKTWEPAAREWMRRLDHSAIFLLIAGTFTPMCLLLPERRAVALALVWIVAGLGVLRAVFWRRAPKQLVAALSVAFGCGAVPLLGQVRAAVGASGFFLVIAGGLLYIAGAAVYALRRPDPAPRVFGYHEIFHGLVVVASVCHYIAIMEVVRVLGAV
jgi:hemolysin III